MYVWQKVKGQESQNKKFSSSHHLNSSWVRAPPKALTVQSLEIASRFCVSLALCLSLRNIQSVWLTTSGSASAEPGSCFQILYLPDSLALKNKQFIIYLSIYLIDQMSKKHFSFLNRYLLYKEISASTHCFTIYKNAIHNHTCTRFP